MKKFAGYVEGIIAAKLQPAEFEEKYETIDDMLLCASHGYQNGREVVDVSINGNDVEYASPEQVEKITGIPVIERKKKIEQLRREISRIEYSIENDLAEEYWHLVLRDVNEVVIQGPGFTRVFTRSADSFQFNGEEVKYTSFTHYLPNRWEEKVVEGVLTIEVS